MFCMIVLFQLGFTLKDFTKLFSLLLVTASIKRLNHQGTAVLMTLSDSVGASTVRSLIVFISAERPAFGHFIFKRGLLSLTYSII